MLIFPSKFFPIKLVDFSSRILERNHTSSLVKRSSINLFFRRKKGFINYLSITVSARNDSERKIVKKEDGKIINENVIYVRTPH